MNTVRSKDGTAIAFDRVGRGTPLILVEGALCYRAMGPSTPLARLLAPYFTVFTYDRRGRGESGDTAPYAVEREIEDLAALLAEVGGSAFVWGQSSGAALALEAANRLSGITRLALFEAPFMVEGSGQVATLSWIRIRTAIVAGDRGDAVKTFLKSVGVPWLITLVMRWMPVWPKLVAIAHTLPYDGAIVEENQLGKPLPAARWASVKVPTLVMAGGKSPVWMRQANQSLASILPNARYRELAGQTHNVKPEAHAPLLAEFFRD